MVTKQKTPGSKSRGKAAGRAQDAVALLKADHATVEELFEQFGKARSDDRKLKLAQSVCQELTIHMTLEEEIFYPAARKAIEADDLLDEADVEHQSAKELIRQIKAGKPGDDKWDAKVKVLGEYIKHHVKEEHTEMFPKVRKTALDLNALGEKMLARKQQLGG